MIEKPIDTQKLKMLSSKWEKLNDEVEKVVFGYSEIVKKISMGLLCNGHILLEGVPGVAKTTLVKTISKCIGLDFSRIQFTPDLLPSDVVGTVIYNPKNHEFETRKGPIFAGMILADEVNRAPAKVQSALLEAMEEHQVTIGNNTFKLDYPLIVLATQNPIDQEGTYSLPEAQIDRFMFKLLLSYPEREDELLIAKKEKTIDDVEQVLNKEDILFSQEVVKTIFIDEKIVNYILDIVISSRKQNNKIKDILKFIRFGASPRATIFLTMACKARAFLSGRDFVSPDDVKAIVKDILRHRIMLTYEAEVDGITSELIIDEILNNVTAP